MTYGKLSRDYQRYAIQKKENHYLSGSLIFLFTLNNFSTKEA